MEYIKFKPLLILLFTMNMAKVKRASAPSAGRHYQWRGHHFVMRRRTKAKDLQQVLTSLHNATHPKQSPTQCIPCIIFRLPIFSVVAVFTPAHWLIIRNRDIFWRGRFCFWRRKFVATTYTLSGLCDSPHLHLQGQIEVCNSAYFLCGRKTSVVAMICCCCIHVDIAWAL